MCRLLWILASLLVLKYSNSQDLITKCEDGWDKILEKCYLIVPYTHSWEQARQHCSTLGSVLAQPTGYQLSDDLSQRVQRRGIERFWIGYNRVGHESEDAYNGYWSDGAPTGVDVGAWAPYQPDNSTGSCAYIGAQWQGAGRKLWYMTSCDNVMSYVCERTACPTDTFTCMNGRCVGYPTVCDGHNNCGDGSDETGNCSCNRHFKTETGALDFGTNDYVANADCTFTIEVSTGKRVQIQIDRFDIEDKLDVLEIWDGPTILSGHLVTRISGSTSGTFRSYVSSRNVLVLRFLSDGSVQKSGFSLSWSTDFHCEMRRIRGVTAPASQAGYEKPLTNRQDENDCRTECERTGNCWAFRYDVTQVVDRKCVMILETPILSDDACCDVYVKTCPGRSRVTAIESFPMPANNLVAEVGYLYIYTPLYPFLYVGNYEQTFTISVPRNQLITLQVLKADLCCTDTITVYDGTGPGAGLLSVISQQSAPGVVISTGNQLYVHMNLQQHWSCSGALLGYKAGCDIEMPSESGVIKSPGYDLGGYPEMTSCTWKILPSAGNSIKLTFEDFDTEEDMDFLEIYEGPDDQGQQNHTGNGYHGNVIPPTLSTSVGLFLRFTSSAVGKQIGFHAVYSSGCPTLMSGGLVVTPSSFMYHAPDIVQLTCADGYFLGGSHVGQDSVSLRCLNNGTWEADSMPFCERGYCGFAPTIPNGYFVYGTGARGGDVITYACKSGYAMTGSPSITCQSDNQWEEPPQCLSPQCTDLSTTFPAGSLSLIRGNGTEHDSVVQVMCPEYQELIGPQTIHCYGGDWRIGLPSCRLIPCAVFDVVNGDVDLSTPYNEGDDVNVRCHAGYYVTGSQLVYEGMYKCGVDAPIKCENIDECGEGLHECQGATCEDTDGGYMCTCLQGYVPMGSSGTTCQDVDECSLGVALCEHDCTNTPGSYTCSCRAGHDLYAAPGFAGLELASGEDGSQPWHRFHVGHSCVLKTCEADVILNIADGVALTTKTSFVYGDDVEYLCNVGFYVTGTSQSRQTITCNIDGEWDDTPQCEYAFCPETYNGDVVPQGQIRYGEVFTLTCTKRNGDTVQLEQRCGYDKATGTYRTIGDTLECPETDCGQFPVIPGVRDGFYTPCTTFNCSVLFRCKPQYERRGTSPQGDYEVRCDAEGNWALGSLHCEGGQCPDPGYPVDGYTTFSTWTHGPVRTPTLENGTVASFSCVRSGYEPVPSGTMVCTPQGDRMAWTGLQQLPTCIDTEPPQFRFCPESDLYVESFGTAFYTEPIATDNTHVDSLEIFPTNFRPGMTVSSSLTITYHATDPAGNEEWCAFRILIRDVVAPEVECSRPDIIVAAAMDQVYNTRPYVYVDDSTAIVSTSPESVLVNYATAGTNPIVNYTASDPSGNTAGCSSQLRIEAPACTDGTLRVYNGRVECSYQAANGGYSCNIRCNNNYVFYESPLTTSLGVGCSSGGAWSREMPVCTDVMPILKYRPDVGQMSSQAANGGYSCNIRCNDNYVFFESPLTTSLGVGCSSGGTWSREMTVCTVTDLAFYRVSYQFSYAGGNSGCAANYQQRIQENLFQLANNFTGLCRAATSDSANIDVSAANVSPVTVSISQQGDVDVTLVLDIAPQGLNHTQYVSCASVISNALASRDSSVSSISTLAGNQFCAAVFLEANSNQQVAADYICSSAAKPSQGGVNYYYCLACPPGTYSDGNDCMSCPAGTYNDGYYATACKTCPVGTNSSAVGLMYQKGCYDDCGLYLYSPTGKAPCSSCPRDTYWVSGTECRPCPSGYYTKRTGARSSTECVAPCAPGSFSADGLAPCHFCPRHYWQASSRATACVECDLDQITLNINSTTEAQCVDGASTLCLPGTCQNGGTCSVLRHVSYCACLTGYTGYSCESIVDPCDQRPCQNGGTCSSPNLIDYTCACPVSYTGEHCEIDIEDDCADSPCLNNGTCIDQRDTYLCTCPSYSGYYGDQCHLETQPCIVSPCENGGVCYPQDNYNRVCNCGEGYTGQDCQTNRTVSYNGITVSATDECVPDPCMNEGYCRDGHNNFTCTCPAGYAGRYCEQRDPTVTCPETFCDNARDCVDNYVADKRFCVCNEGFFYDDISEVCAVKQITCNPDCGTNGTCASNDGGYNTRCDCDVGYGGTSCDVDVDFCTYRPCKNGGACVDGVDNFTCTCPTAGTGGFDCSDTEDGCVNCNVANTASCTDTAGGYTCFCKDGYTGTDCQLTIPTCDTLPCRHDGQCSNPASPETHVCDCAEPWSGLNCERETDNCVSGQECENGGTCQSTSDGFICECPLGYIGDRCEDEYDLCNRTQPCSGDVNTCTNTDSGTACTCDRAYTGESCETLLWFCSDTTCQNGGICDVIDNVGTRCTCLAGFTGSDCGTNIDECVTTSCPANSVCRDGINQATCVCMNGMMGENCSKRPNIDECAVTTRPTNSMCRDCINQATCVCMNSMKGENCSKPITLDFDYVMTRSTACEEYQNYLPFTLDTSTALSLAFWFRLTLLNNASSIVTVYGEAANGTVSPTSWSYRLQISQRHVKADFPASSATLPFETDNDNVNVADGLWHHITLTWNNVNGFLTLFVDGVYNNGVVVARGEQITQTGYAQLGTGVSETPGFTGRFSQVLVLGGTTVEDEAVEALYARQETTLYNSLVAENLLPKVDTALDHMTADFSSQLTNGVCTSAGNCPDRAFSESEVPSVTSCPGDTGAVTERVATPTWDTPTFDRTDPESGTSTAESGQTIMGWGAHGVSYAEYNSDHSAAVCTFRVFNTRGECAAPIAVENAACPVSNANNVRWCQLGCSNSGFSPAYPAPTFYTCSKYGMWDEADRTTEFVLPTCARSYDPSNTVTTSFEYDLASSCQSLRADLETRVTDALVAMNTDWLQGLCRTSTGVSDVTCSDVSMEVTCSSDNRAAVSIGLANLGDLVDSMSRSLSPEDAMKVALVDEDRFTFVESGAPVVTSIVVQTSPTCRSGSHLVGGVCVDCGSGYSYSATTATCEPCAVGSYRTAGSNSDPLAACTRCSGSDTTDNPGATSVDMCHESCYLGNFYNASAGACSPCPEGFYSDRQGVSSCAPCGIDETTRGDRATSANACISLSHLTTTTLPTGQPAVGASTEEKGLSNGALAAIVVCVLLVVIVILVVLFLCLTKRLPCMAEDTKVKPSGEPWTHVKKYGETNLRFVNYSLSEVKEGRSSMKHPERMPIYTGTVTPPDDVSVTRTDISLQVPIFTERLNGIVHKKHTYVSTGGHPDLISSDLDHTLDRPPSEYAPSEVTGYPESGLSESGRVNLAYQRTLNIGTSAAARSPGSSRRHARRTRRGRPPSDLSQDGPLQPLPRTLSPIGTRSQVPHIHTSEFVRSLPQFEHQRLPVDRHQYQEFLESPRPSPRPTRHSRRPSPPRSQGSSSRILLSDEEDFR